MQIIKIKKPAVDLTDLALGIVVLGLVVSIGANILIGLRDSQLDELDSVLTLRETLTTVTESGETLTNSWVSTVNNCSNATGGQLINTANYTVTISDLNGYATVKALPGSNYNNSNWNCSYTWYNTSRADWSLANNASIGISEYGDWFSTIVIVGVAAVVISLIFMAFGRGGGSISQTNVGGVY